MSDFRTTLLEEFQDEEYAHAYCDDFLNTYIATQLKVLREQRNWTQEDVAQRAGMKQPRIALLEDINHDAWSVKTLRRLGRAFDVRLKVSFEEFSTIIDDVCSFNRLNLERASRPYDLDRTKRIVTGSSVITDFAQFSKSRNEATQYKSLGQDRPSDALSGSSSIQRPPSEDLLKATLA
jgi:transcriptional regulator with XRE-family HTH domain